LKTCKITALAAILITASVATAQTHTAKHHAITEDDVTLIHDCHAIYLDVEGTDLKPSRVEEPVYSTLIDRDKLSESDGKLYGIVKEDVAYFGLNLDSFEK
jgi:hypothetical protein